MALRERRLNAEVNLHRLKQVPRKRLKFSPPKKGCRTEADASTAAQAGQDESYSGRLLSDGHRSAHLAAAAYISCQAFLLLQV